MTTRNLIQFHFNDYYRHTQNKVMTFWVDIHATVIISFHHYCMRLVQSIYEKMLKSDLPLAERSRLIKGIVNSFIIQGFSMVLVFAGNYLLVKFFGAEKYGVYVHVFNWISILTILAANGQEDVVLSRVPKYLAQNNLVQTGAVIRHANVRIAINWYWHQPVLFTAYLYFPHQ